MCTGNIINIMDQNYSTTGKLKSLVFNYSVQPPDSNPSISYFGARTPSICSPPPHATFRISLCWRICEQGDLPVPSPHPILSSLSFCLWASKGNIYPSTFPSFLHSPLLHSRSFRKPLTFMFYSSILFQHLGLWIVNSKILFTMSSIVGG